jgi:glycosyltransferase-like protein
MRKTGGVRMSTPLRVAILAHSTNPRGGVVHALELGDGLARLGHDVTVFAPAVSATGFFRDTVCKTICVPASPVRGGLRALVETYAADYVRFFERVENRRFDVWHAQDGISANALATLKERGLISGFARTIHHVDDFTDERLSALQLRAITAADRLFVVGRLWQEWLVREHGRNAHYVGNGVDTERFSAVADETDAELRERLGLPPGVAVFLAVGGVEERKNTIRILQAFEVARSRHPNSRLVIAGGASLLDHSAYQARFTGALAHGGETAAAVIRTGPLRQRLMPALYRAATSLVFPSTSEGFGLAVLEAMASGVPVVTSRIAPFTEYLGESDVAWCDPYDAVSIGTAMVQSLDSNRRAQLIERGFTVAARHDWASTARAHLLAYEALREPVHA